MSTIGEGMELLGLFDKAKNADLYKQLGDWIEKVRILQIENDRLLTEQKQLKEQLRFTGFVERIDGHTFVDGDDEEVCPRCAEVERRPVHLMQILTKQTGMRVTCPSCKLELPNRYPKKRSDPAKEKLSPVPNLRILFIGVIGDMIHIHSSSSCSAAASSVSNLRAGARLATLSPRRHSRAVTR